MRALNERLTAVEGLEHVLTRFSDSCASTSNGSIFEHDWSPCTLTCSMRADAYFGIRGDIHWDRGRDPDGTLRPAPTLEAPGLRIDWGRPDLPRHPEVRTARFRRLQQFRVVVSEHPRIDDRDLQPVRPRVRLSELQARHLPLGAVTASAGLVGAELHPLGLVERLLGAVNGV
ncbi:hypothetical protein [Streptomyces hirsutus]|uniref:hypothetical protein n=1 Tax=Streptomyces hirsutus TaxID=35620 RepID=UPI00368DF99B